MKPGPEADGLRHKAGARLTTWPCVRQLMVTVQEPANDALGVATTKEVEVLLKFEGVFSGKVLYLLFLLSLSARK